MAAFCGDEECRAHVEGEGSVVTSYRAAAGYSAEIEWKQCEDVFRELGDCTLTLATAETETAVKVIAFDPRQKDSKFEGVFDNMSLISAGMDSRCEFEENLDTLRGALKGSEFTTAQLLTADGGGVVLRITEDFRRKTFEYRLSLRRVTLDESDALGLELGKVKAETAAKIDKLTTELRQMTAKHDAVVKKWTASEKKSRTMKGRITSLKKQNEELEFETAALKERLAHSSERFHELEAQLRRGYDHGMDPRFDAMVEEKKDAIVGAAADSVRRVKKAFTFDRSFEAGVTKPSVFSVKRYSTTAEKGSFKKWAQILVSPQINAGEKRTIAFKLVKFAGDFTVGFTDKRDSEVWKGAAFYTDGTVMLNGGFVVKNWKKRTAPMCKSGDVWQLTVSIERGVAEVQLKAPNGQCTLQWKPKCLPVWAGFGSIDAGNIAGIV